MTKKGGNHSIEHCRNLSLALKGRKFSLETRRKMSEAKRGMYLGENNPMFGKHRPDLSEYNKTKEHRDAIKTALSGKLKSDEHKRNLSIAKKRECNTEEGKNRLRAQRMKQKIPKKMTSIELKIRDLLDLLRIPYKTHKSIMGITQPDFFIEPNICIYCDGDYWHSLPVSMERDKKINEMLKFAGYKVIRLKECDINNRFEEVKTWIDNAL